MYSIIFHYYSYDRGRSYIMRFFLTYLSPNHPYSSQISFENQFQIFLNDITEPMQAYLYVFGTYSDGATRFMERVVKQGDTVIDVGANIGCISLKLSKAVGQTGKVIAIEPDKSNFRMMQKNLGLNNIKNVLLLLYAASYEEKTLRFYLANKGSIGMHSGLYNNKVHSSSFVEVPATTIDNITNAINIVRVKLVKIDVEGVEIDVIKGMHQLILRDHPIIVVEICAEFLNLYGMTVKQFKEYMLNQYGYVSFKLTKKGELLYSDITEFHILEDIVFIHQTCSLESIAN